jgi:hypothetical protein
MKTLRKKTSPGPDPSQKWLRDEPSDGACQMIDLGFVSRKNAL